MTLLSGRSTRTPEDQQQVRRNLATAAAATCLVIIVAFAAASAYSSGGQDFRGYYAAARVLAQGGDPYDYRQIGDELTRSTDKWTDHRFFYPPWLALGFLPLAPLPYGLARLAWLAVNVAALAAGALLWRRNAGWPPLDWRAALLGLGLFYPLGWVALQSEQITILLALCLGLAAFSGGRKGALLCGIGLALLLTKPNVTFAAIALIVLVLLRSRRFTELAAAAVATLLLLAAGTVAMPNWLQQLANASYNEALWGQLSGSYGLTGIRVHATIQPWLMSLGAPREMAVAANAAAAAVGIALAWLAIAGRLTTGSAAAWGMLAGLLVTPYAYEYDYILLAPLMIVLWHGTTRLRAWRLAAVLGLWAAFYTMHFWGHWMSDAFWAPLIFLALGLATGELQALFRRAGQVEPASTPSA